MNQELNHQLSQQAAELVKAQPKACWRNAILAQQHYSKANYVEGWVVSRGVVIEHGWLEMEDKVIDPTLISRLNNDAEPPTYFPGVRYTCEEAFDVLAEREGELPLVCRDGHWGRETPPYMLAYCDAWEYTLTRSHVTVEESFIQHLAETRRCYEAK